jgi:hypothetical protein
VPRHLRIIALPRGDTPSAETRPAGATPITLDELPGYDVYIMPAGAP